ncbi:MAG TPA: outer membrane beta-barrel protein [Longimicrobiales bacterium]|nr:outer membrane beta-barrel protein [Longimicrobiales bacterium]
MGRTTTGRPALALALLGALAGGVQGQSATSVGARAGLLISTAVFEDPSTNAQTGVLTGVQLGVAVSRDLGRFAAVEGGVQLSREGFGGEGAHSGDLRTDNVSLPVLVRLRTPGRRSFHVTVGAAAKLSLRCRQVGVAVVGDMPCDDPVLGARWKAFDVAALVGAGVGLPFSGRRVVVDMLLSWGLRDVDGSQVVPGTARNVSLGLSAAVLSPWSRGGSS